MAEATHVRHAIAPADDRLVNIREVTNRTALHAATIYRKLAEGKFPPGKLIGTRRRWWLSEVLSWIDDQPAN